MSVRIWVMAASAWAMAAVPALAGGPELAGGPGPDAYAQGQSYSHSTHVEQYQGQAPSRPPYVAPDEPGYPPVQSYGFRGYDQAVYAAGPSRDGAFRGYDQAVYAAEGQSRYSAGEAYDRGYRETQTDRSPPPPEPARAPPSEAGPACPSGPRGERVVHCEYRPYWQEVTVSGEFTGGVGVIPVGGGGSGGVVIVNTGGFSAGGRTRAYVSTSAAASVRIGGGGCGRCGGTGY